MIFPDNHAYLAPAEGTTLTKADVDQAKANGSLVSVVLGETVKAIAPMAFADCETLASVKLPGSLRLIARGAFRDCHNLRNVVFPDSLEVMGKGAFAGCKSLEWARLPQGIVTLPKQIFSGCKALDTVVLPDSIESIGEEAFDGCTVLKTVNVPVSLRTIAEAAFRGCRSLSDFPLPEQTRCASTAFDGCPAVPDAAQLDGCSNEELARAAEIERMIENASGKDDIEDLRDALIDYVGLDAVQKRLDKLEHFKKMVSKYNEKKLREEGVISKKAPAKLSRTKVDPHLLEGNESVHSTEDPDTITEIGEYAHAGCVNMRLCFLSKNLEKIGDAAFSGCKKLYLLDLPGKVCEIGRCAFHDCENAFGHLHLPASLRRLGWGAFGNCRSMTSLDIDYGLQGISECAFNGCTSLRRASLPESLLAIGKEAFFGCESLERLSLPGCLRSIGSGAFSFCSKLEKLVLPEGPETIALLPEGTEPDTEPVEDDVTAPRVLGGGYDLYHDALVFELKEAGLATQEDLDTLLAVQGRGKKKHPAGPMTFSLTVGLEELDKILPKLRIEKEPFEDYHLAEAELEKRLHTLRAEGDDTITFAMTSYGDEPQSSKETPEADALVVSPGVLADSSVRTLVLPDSMKSLAVPFFEGCDTLKVISVAAGTKLGRAFRKGCKERSIRIVTR